MGRKPCCSKEEVNRGTWSFQEDEILTNYINTTHGVGKWRDLPPKAGLKRCGKSCRLRWLNYLRPEIKRGNISKDEQDLIIRLHSLLGNRWSLTAGRLPGRTDNEIKNYWNTNIAKRVSCQNSPSISAQKGAITLEEKKVILHDKVSNNNIHLIRTKAIRHGNLKSLMNQDQRVHHRPNEAINCNDTNMPNSIAHHSVDSETVYELDVERMLADDHGHGQSSSNNTSTALTPEIEAGYGQIGLQNTNLDDHFPRADNDKPFIMNDDEDDQGKSIRSLPYSDLLIDANGIEIKMVDKVDEEQEINGEPNMGINLMLELKKMASFLEVENEWNII